MSTQARDESNESRLSTGDSALEPIRNRTSSLLIVFGAVLILIGFVLQDGVWAAIIPLWGIAITLLGLIGAAYVWYTYGT